MITAIVQARTGSTRLPNKVMMDLKGKAVLMQIIDRLKQSKRIDKIVVATTVKSSDDVIEKLCIANKVDYFRGSEDDVLDRYYNAYKYSESKEEDILIRITGDCPLIDPKVIDEVVDFYIAGDYDYASNVIEPTFPDGLDTEVFRGKVLEETWENAKLSSEREHVTPYIRNNPDRYKLGSYKGNENLSNLRWTLDEIEDYEMIKEVYDALYKAGEIFLMEEILQYIDKHPEILDKNRMFMRNEGYEKSLIDDKVLDGGDFYEQ